MTRVKICGICTEAAALAAAEAGADAVGFVFYPGSSRYVSPERAAQLSRLLPPFVVRVGVFVNAPVAVVERISDQVGLDLVQLHGDEPPEVCARAPRRVIKAVRVEGTEALRRAAEYPACAVLLDAYVPGRYGGTGRPFDWSLLCQIDRPVILSGGLTPENVAEAVRRVRPYAVDVSSGVETDGEKDPRRIEAFVRAVREVDRELQEVRR
ncbi:MAG: phosphoribosylanthranilate isomerase [Armatimonadota bacterium]|nr:phosphoribosylanthranilate isomerase [Armatimonadota bacterium]MDR5689837.1 phosphoribosylanthranilate isomerase [Armatimonadota bacterium]MDR7387952.1 phosphoribosylanthranilate isomerase [Armatimonadota bacterium]MDR7390398.1 phosphoribosylanthranilate isomerase [Armatimonadota bacterium]MDR7391823.1 phosphoribosylanthranilate isomerase [Armatimonadota bacterium]